jgi:hypothetical protein
MTPDLDALARRAVVCKGWRWLPGMRTTDAMRVVHDQPLFPGRPCAIREGAWVDTFPPRPLRDALPDLADPATLGCLLALVRQAYDEPEIGLEYDAVLSLWGVFAANKGTRGTRRRGEGATEAEALIDALETA